MGAYYAEDGTLLGGCWPTWDAHHFHIKRRAGVSDERWAAVLAEPDWNDHAREDLQAERVCEWCLTEVARGHGTGGPEAQREAREELARRGIDWAAPRTHQDEITEKLRDYRARKDALGEARREMHRQIADSELPTTQIAKITGYSRERVRQIRKAQDGGEA
jgi:hypothetical protein